MSLGHVLSGCKRVHVPDHLLMLCRAADAPVVDNILTVLQDIVPCANITLAVLRVHSNLYEISIPVRSGQVSLQQMVALQLVGVFRRCLHHTLTCLTLGLHIFLGRSPPLSWWR